MEMSFAIQLVGIAGTLLYFVSYQCKTNRNLFRVQCMSYLCYTAHLLLLGALTGGLSYIVNTIRSLFLASKWKFAKGRGMCAAVCLAQLAVLLLTWSGPLSLLPVMANIASTIGGYTHDARKIRYVGIFINSPLWMTYDFLVGSCAGVLDEGISILSMVISLIRFREKQTAGMPPKE